jgi:NarL family two-component system response regulator LiaR
MRNIAACTFEPGSFLFPQNRGDSVETSQIRVVIAEDHTVFRQCLCFMLARNQSYTIAGETSSAEELLKFCRSSNPHVVIVDIQLAGGNGLDAAEKLLLENPELPVIVLSSFYEVELVEKAISIGVRGYFPKYATLQEINEAIPRAARGEKVFHKDITDLLLNSYQKRLKGKNNHLLHEDEVCILKMCSEGKSYSEIAEALFIGERTLYRRLNVIFEKLGVSSKVQAVAAAIRKGLV